MIFLFYEIFHKFLTKFTNFLIYRNLNTYLQCTLYTVYVVIYCCKMVLNVISIKRLKYNISILQFNKVNVILITQCYMKYYS